MDVWLEDKQKSNDQQYSSDSHMSSPSIGSTKAEEYVMNHNHGLGSYLVRPNTNNDPTFVSITTSITNDCMCCHARVHICQTHAGWQYYISDKLKFDTFAQLLDYYSVHRIHCLQNIDNIRLLTPLNVSGRRTSQTSRQPKRDSDSVSVRSSGSGSNCFLDSGGEEKPVSSGSSGSDEGHAGLGSRRGSGNVGVAQPGFPKHRTTSESAIAQRSMSTGKGDTSRRAKLVTSSSMEGREPPFLGSKAKRSQSESQIQGLKQLQKTSKTYANAKAIVSDPKFMIKCRPPAPLPRPPQEEETDSTFYYSYIDANRNFFEDTYNMLKENELCECGLRLVDSELPLGWTVHLSNDPSTKSQIFFQKGEKTSWDIPEYIIKHLAQQHIDFILFLCQKHQMRLPNWLKRWLDEHRGRQRGSSVPVTPSGSISGLSSSTGRMSKIVEDRVIDTPTQSSQYRASSLRTTSGGTPEDFRSSGPYETPGGLLTLPDGGVVNQEVSQRRDGAPMTISITRPPSFNSTPAVTISTKIGSPNVRTPEMAPSMTFPLYNEEQQFLRGEEQTEQLRQELQRLQAASLSQHSTQQLAHEHDPSLQQQQQQLLLRQQQQRRQQQSRLSQEHSTSQQRSLDKFIDSQNSTQL